MILNVFLVAYLETGTASAFQSGYLQKNKHMNGFPFISKSETPPLKISNLGQICDPACEKPTEQ